MTVWVYRTQNGQPHWSSTRWIAFDLGNYQITEVRTEQDALHMRDVFTMTTDEWFSLRVRAGLPMYPPKQRNEPDTREVVRPKAVERTFEAGTVCAHSDAAGLMVRVVAMLDGGRVMAKVLQAGVTHLNAGHEYPFRADLLAEVSA